MRGFIMRKKLWGLSFVFLSSLLLGACGNNDKATLQAKTLELYTSASKHASVSFYFEESSPDVPLIALSDAQVLLQQFVAGDTTTGYAITASKGEGLVTWSRENGSTATFNFNDKTVTFSSFEAFSAMPYAATPIDPVSIASSDSNSKPLYIVHDQSGSSINNPGSSLLLDLAHYEIPMIYEKGEGYIPLQFFSDFFASQTFGLFVYNGASVFVLGGSSLGEMSDLYYSVGTRSRSDSLASFNYHELCLSLDVYYGLKSQHGISDFDTYLSASGLKDEFLSNDGVVADNALLKLTNFHFEDLHSGFNAPSSYAGLNSIKRTYSPDMYAQEMTMFAFLTKRKTILGDTPKSYYEQGDTAFVTFDHFTGLSGDYYTTKPTENPTLEADDSVMAPDTFAVVIYAHSQITRENSPIKNVVIDLSCNGGGALDALAYVAGWLISDDVLDVVSSADGMRVENCYHVDTNLDKTYDASDNISDKRLYCLVSPNSFSCGNYLPSMLKVRQKATLIGQTSGGGSCMVKNLTTADGSIFQISGNMVMSVAHNGTFVDIDQGMSPDYRLNDISAYYDRATLASDIDSGVYGRIVSK
jgi:hypothetical protein